MAPRSPGTTATLALFVIALPGLLTPRPGARPEVDLHIGAWVGSDLPRASCRPINRGLRFEWLQAGDEPLMHGYGQLPVCLAVYQIEDE